MSATIRIEHPILSHPWYKMWECGELPVESLRHYAQEYFWQVAHFPRYLSRLHSQVSDLKTRQVILENLADEENPKSPHPELWLDFAEALGLDRDKVRSSSPSPAAQELIHEFQSLIEAGVPEGLGAILAYESQVPAVAQFKSKALESYYLQKEKADQGTRFFRVHQEADVWHTKELDDVVASLSTEDRQKAQVAADKASLALWKFLDAMPGKH